MRGRRTSVRARTEVCALKDSYSLDDNICVTNWGLCQGPISHNNEQTQSVEGII